MFKKIIQLNRPGANFMIEKLNNTAKKAKCRSVLEYSIWLLLLGIGTQIATDVLLFGDFLPLPTQYLPIVSSVKAVFILAVLSIVFTYNRIKADSEADISIKTQLDVIERTKQDLLALIDSSPDNIWYMNKELDYLYGNSSFISSFTAATHVVPIPGEKIKKYLPDALNEYQKPYYDRAAKGEFVQYTMQAPTKDGDNRHIQFIINPIYDSEGSFIGFGCFAHDFTELLYAQEQLNQQNLRLRNIAWYQSHLVRGPVASILGLVHIFNKENIHDPFNIEILDHLQRAAKQLDSAVQEIVKEADPSPKNQT